jgi:hypothetical protein
MVATLDKALAAFLARPMLALPVTSVATSLARVPR